MNTGNQNPQTSGRGVVKCHHILLIEDERDLRETLQELLEMTGFKVETAANGREALHKLQEMGRPCLIMLDLMMPVMNGWQFLEAIRQDGQHGLDKIPVIVVSAALDMVDVGREYGCQAMRKPVEIDQLLALAHEHCPNC